MPKRHLASAKDSVVKIASVNVLTGRQSYCAGVAISPTEIATAGHCVGEYKYPTITTRDGQGCRPVSVVISGKADVALLTVAECRLHAAPLGPAPSEGAVLAPIGHPGKTWWSMSVGLAGELRSDGMLNISKATIQPGSSGGGVFDREGMLVAVISVLYWQPHQFTGAAVPIARATELR